jgi:hypothetical protein
MLRPLIVFTIVGSISLFATNTNAITISDLTAVPESCIRVFDLTPGSKEFPADKKGLTDLHCQAYQYLLDTRNACSGGQGITGASSPKDCIRSLDKDFAVNLKELFVKNPALFANIKILSGYRTAQGEILVSGKDTGNHRRGCAVDLTGANSSNTSCLEACKFVRASGTQFKIKLPYFYSPEYNHIEPLICAGGGISSGSSITQGNIAAGMAPIQNGFQGLQNLLTPQPPTCQPGFIQMSGQCMPGQQSQQMQSPFNIPMSQSAPSMPPPTSLPAPMPPPMTGTSNLIPAIANTNPNTNTNTNTSNAVATSDLINAIAYPTTTSPTVTTVTPGSASIIHTSVSLEATPIPATTGTVAILPTNTLVPPSGQTFTSQDTSQVTVPAYAPAPSIPAAVLETLRQVLVAILKWLSLLRA